MFNQKGNLSLILGIALLMTVIGVGAYYLGTQKNNSNSQINSQISVAPTPIVSPIEKTSSDPNNWDLKTNLTCGVKFTLPPNNEPYVEFIDQNTTDPDYRRFWQVREGSYNDFFKQGISIMHGADIEASGFISGGVFVECNNNTGDTIDGVINSYAKSVDTPIDSNRKSVMWDKPVNIVKFYGGLFGPQEFYFLQTKNYSYKIYKKSDSQNNFVKETTDKIFNSIQFTD